MAAAAAPAAGAADFRGSTGRFFDSYRDPFSRHPFLPADSVFARQFRDIGVNISPLNHTDAYLQDGYVFPLAAAQGASFRGFHPHHHHTGGGGGGPNSKNQLDLQSVASAPPDASVRFSYPQKRTWMGAGQQPRGRQAHAPEVAADSSSNANELSSLRERLQTLEAVCREQERELHDLKKASQQREVRTPERERGGEGRSSPLGSPRSKSRPETELRRGSSRQDMKRSGSTNGGRPLSSSSKKESGGGGKGESYKTLVNEARNLIDTLLGRDSPSPSLLPAGYSPRTMATSAGRVGASPPSDGNKKSVGRGRSFRQGAKGQRGSESSSVTADRERGRGVRGRRGTDQSEGKESGSSTSGGRGRRSGGTRNLARLGSRLVENAGGREKGGRGGGRERSVDSGGGGLSSSVGFRKLDEALAVLEGEESRMLASLKWMGAGG
uniref:Uncharacterized protein n=1 Tax=Chromera velia CCMP2878 TaxID=1169474 RepID=A0A0G4F0H4_9ALVE|eukprot:Cvel_14333.t1-p1 / transcript=Cvel_14333.t1 / gene=Cvel_14333 / organism=Chromera_velia_CCMP2878 / gene_product=hypothetical protein / transcript_product=hypothetical protein / location=Cvel_scaffold1015:3158-4471(+) / protein_length=438 / sequence_SO=supercontig / SO=protein_coding / is_pseudo=false